MAPQMRYWSIEEGGQPVGLVRMVKDDAAQTLDLERYDGEGSWVDDPGSIEDIRSEGAREITDPDELASVRTEIARVRGELHPGVKPEDAGAA